MKQLLSDLSFHMKIDLLHITSFRSFSILRNCANFTFLMSWKSVLHSNSCTLILLSGDEKTASSLHSSVKMCSTLKSGALNARSS